ncbi:MAG TPA: FliM/FliN family flagellar motor switch protein [Bacteroidota bacterium]
MPETSTLLESNPSCHSASSGVSGVDTKSDKETVRFDFRLPRPISIKLLKDFQTIHKNFEGILGAYLASRLQTNAGIKIVSVNQLLYSDFVLSIPNPSCLYLCRVAEVNAAMLLEFSPQLALIIVERLLGGSGDHDSSPRRLTRIEQRLVQGIVLQALGDLARSWKNTPGLTLSLERHESEKDLAQIVPESEITFIISFEVNISDRQYQMNLCLPKVVFDAVLDKQSAQDPSIGDDKVTGEILRELIKTTVSATATLVKTGLTVRELNNLEPGDIIRTSIPINGEVNVSIGDKPLFTGRASISNGKRAIIVTKPLNGQGQGAKQQWQT